MSLAQILFFITCTQSGFARILPGFFCPRKWLFEEKNRGGGAYTPMVILFSIIFYNIDLLYKKLNKGIVPPHLFKENSNMFNVLDFSQNH